MMSAQLWQQNALNKFMNSAANLGVEMRTAIHAMTQCVCLVLDFKLMNAPCVMNSQLARQMASAPAITRVIER